MNTKIVKDGLIRWDMQADYWMARVAGEGAVHRDRVAYTQGVDNEPIRRGDWSKPE
jgi:hypothetical protein